MAALAGVVFVPATAGAQDGGDEDIIFTTASGYVKSEANCRASLLQTYVICSGKYTIQGSGSASAVESVTVTAKGSGTFSAAATTQTKSSSASCGPRLGSCSTSYVTTNFNDINVYMDPGLCVTGTVFSSVTVETRTNLGGYDSDSRNHRHDSRACL